MKKLVVAAVASSYLAAFATPSAEGWFKDSVVGEVTITAGTSTPPVPPQCAHLTFAHTISGTPGNDHITGTNANDLIFGLGGDDHIEGKNGQDCIVGGDGNDHISGGNARDYLFGGPGNDEIDGGNGGDTIRGGDGTDFCEGNNGPDIEECETIEATGDGAGATGTPVVSISSTDDPKPASGRARGDTPPSRSDTSAASGRTPAPSRTPTPVAAPEPPLVPATLPTPDTFHHTRGNEAGVPAQEDTRQWPAAGVYRKP